jgi:hypothetical protein
MPPTQEILPNPQPPFPNSSKQTQN